MNGEGQDMKDEQNEAGELTGCFGTVQTIGRGSYLALVLVIPLQS